MTPKQWTRIRAHLANEATEFHPHAVIGAVVQGLFEDAIEPPPGAGSLTGSNHAPGGVAPPVCLFGPGGDFRTSWPHEAHSPPSPPGARSDDRAPGKGETT